MNQVVLMGRLTRNPEYKEVQNEKGVHHVIILSVFPGVFVVCVLDFFRPIDFPVEIFIFGNEIASQLNHFQIPFMKIIID